MDDKKTFLSKLGSRLHGQPGFDDLLAMADSPNGFRRENAVRRLGMLANPLAIPCLIARANDWVPQVRTAAVDAITRMLKTGNGSAFVTYLPQILHLEDCRRGDHTALLQSVHSFLLREENRDALMGGLTSTDSRVARTVARLLVRHNLMAPAALVTMGLEHGDVLVRCIVIELLRNLEAEDFDTVAQRALVDPYMPVRREAFQQLLRRSEQQGLGVARRFLFDKSASIREIAIQWLLARSEPVEQIYAEALADQADRVSISKRVLWGWGFMKSRARIETTKAFLDSPFPALRRAALFATAMMLNVEAAPYLEKALGDSSPAVSNEAARLIVRFDVAPDIERLIAISRSSKARHVAYACCRVAREGSKWDWLQFILAVHGQPTLGVPTEILARELQSWDGQFNRTYARVDRRQLDEIARLFGACRGLIPANWADVVQFTLKTHGIVE